MDAAEFDRLVARARNPRLIPGIYNYCDGRCPKCPFTQRCLTFLDTEELKASGDDSRSVADVVGESLQRTLEMLAEAARRDGFDLDGIVRIRWRFVRAPTAIWRGASDGRSRRLPRRATMRR